MQDQSRYAVGIDVGTSSVRCVVGHISDGATGAPKVVAVATVVNSGMRKGTVVTLSGPAEAIDKVLGDAERVSGYEVNDATISINGSHIVSTQADGMIAVGMSGAGDEVTPDDIARIEEVATVGKIPPNRQVLEVVPFSYTIDGQGGVKDPVGMNGTRLEIRANVISALSPHINNLQRAAEFAKVSPNAIIPSVMAAARAVLTESQLENGVAVVDMGAATTSVAVFEEGDLQYVGVVPYGGVNVTNDLAIGLKTDPEVAEQVKLEHASAIIRQDNSEISVKHDKQTYSFDRSLIDDIVEARLEEIFAYVNKELKRAGRAGKLPSGVILVGGAANMRGMVEFAKKSLGVAAKVGRPTGFGGVADGIDKPEYATAVGLMLIDATGASPHAGQGGSRGSKPKSGGILRGLMSKVRSKR